MHVTHHLSAYPHCASLHVCALLPSDLLPYVQTYSGSPSHHRTYCVLLIYVAFSWAGCCTASTAFLNAACPFCQDLPAHIRSTMASLHLSNAARKVVADSCKSDLILFILSTSSDIEKVIKMNLSMMHHSI